MTIEEKETVKFVVVPHLAFDLKRNPVPKNIKFSFFLKSGKGWHESIECKIADTKDSRGNDTNAYKCSIFGKELQQDDFPPKRKEIKIPTLFQKVQFWGESDVGIDLNTGKPLMIFNPIDTGEGDAVLCHNNNLIKSEPNWLTCNNVERGIVNELMKML